MRHNILQIVLIATTMVCGATGEAQYQLPNPGFEEWDGNAVDAEPTHWNSFASSDGSYSSMASSPHHYRRNGHRTGGSGSHYLTIYTKSILGIKANGNMTTGRIHAGSMSAGSSDNYNYTQRSNTAHCQPFSGTPDSMYVWVSFYASSSSSQAQISAILHGDNDFRAPNQENTASLYCGKASQRFARTTTSASQMQWQQLKIPFVYDGTSDARYMLLNMTTNYTPGAGSANDSLSVDDIEFIYSAWLGSIDVDGIGIEGFSKGCFDYTVSVGDIASAVVTAETEADDATVAMQRTAIDDSNAMVTITVTAEDSITTKEYRVVLTSGERPERPVSIDRTETVQLSAYPNPTTGTVRVDGRAPFSLANLSGKVVLTGHAPCTLDMSNLPSGNYVLRCSDRCLLLTRVE